MNNSIEKIIKYRTKLNNINTLLINYANFANKIDTGVADHIKDDLKKELDLITIKINLSNSKESLIELNDKLEQKLKKCMHELNNFVSTTKITEFQKYTKLLQVEMESFKKLDKGEFEKLSQELECISEELNAKLDISKYQKHIETKIANLKNLVESKIDSITDSQSKNMLEDINKDKINMMIKINNFNQILDNFDDEIISSVTTPALNKLLKESTIYLQKQKSSALTTPEQKVLKSLKLQYYNILKDYDNYINVQALGIANNISNFLSDDATKFNSTWGGIITGTIENVTEANQKDMEQTIKDINTAIDNLSKKYGDFIDNLYTDYVEYLTNKQFSN